MAIIIAACNGGSKTKQEVDQAKYADQKYKTNMLIPLHIFCYNNSIRCKCFKSMFPLVPHFR